MTPKEKIPEALLVIHNTVKKEFTNPKFLKGLYVKIIKKFGWLTDDEIDKLSISDLRLLILKNESEGKTGLDCGFVTLNTSAGKYPEIVKFISENHNLSDFPAVSEIVSISVAMGELVFSFKLPLEVQSSVIKQMEIDPLIEPLKKSGIVLFSVTQLD